MRGISEPSVFNSVGMFYNDNDDDDDNDDVSLNRFGSYQLFSLINYNYFNSETVQIFVLWSKIIVIPFYLWTRKGVDVSDVSVNVHTVQKWKTIDFIFIKSWGN